MAAGGEHTPIDLSSADRAAQIRAFVACIFEPADLIEVRMLPIARSSWRKAAELHEFDPEAGGAAGQSIYVGANPRRKIGARDAAGVLCFRCLFADIDGVSIDQAAQRLAATTLPVPTAFVFSGGGVHFYWRLDVPLTDARLWSALQKGIIAALDSDKVIHDPPRIMRLPGTRNQKRAVDARLLEAWPTRRHSISAFPPPVFDAAPVGASPAAPPSPSRARGGAAGGDEASLIMRAEKYLAKIPPAVSGSNGHGQTYAAATMMVHGFGLSVDAAFDLLWSQYNPRCVPPWSERELRHKVADAAAKPHDKPSGWLRDKNAEQYAFARSSGGRGGSRSASSSSPPSPNEDDELAHAEDGGGDGHDGGGGDVGGEGEEHARPPLIDDMKELFGCAGEKEAWALAVLLDRFAPDEDKRKAGSCFGLRFRKGEFFWYKDPKFGHPRWEKVEPVVLESQVTLVLDRYWKMREGKSGATRKPLAPSESQVRQAIKTAISYVNVPAESLPCWLPRSFDESGLPIVESMDALWHTRAEPLPVNRIIPVRNGLLDVSALGEGKVELLPPSPLYFGLSYRPFAFDPELFNAGTEKDAERGVFDLVEEMGLAPNFLGVLHSNSGMSRALATLKELGQTELGANILGLVRSKDGAAAARAAVNAMPEETVEERSIRTACEDLIEAEDWEMCFMEAAGITQILRHGFDSIFVLDGMPGCGKDTLVDGVEAAVGVGNTAMLAFQTLGGRFDTKGLEDKQLYRMSEFRTDRHTDVASALDTLLRMTSSVAIRTEGKGKDADLHVIMTGSVWITQNQFPKHLRDPSCAITRRLRMFPCHPRIDKRDDPGLKNRIKAEAEWLFLMFMEGARRALRRKDVRQPASGTRLLQEIERNLSPVRGFAQDALLFGAGQSIAVDVAVGAFHKWAEENGHSGLDKISSSQFGEDLRAALGIQVERKYRGSRANRGYRYLGFRLAEPADWVDDGAGSKRLRTSRDEPPLTIKCQTELPLEWAGKASEGETLSQAF